VIIKLVMNGIEAMESVTAGPRELVIRSGSDETRRVFISMTDCGVGISAEHADRHGYGTLYLPFDRGSPRGTPVGFPQERPGATFQFVLPSYQEDGSCMSAPDHRVDLPAPS
jgi:hypothetical protein